MAEQVRELDHTGREDDRRGQQKGKPRRVIVVEPPREAGAHRHAVAADARHERRRLRDAHDQRLAILERPEFARAVGLCALAQGKFPHLRLTAEALGREQDEAVDHQEDRRNLRLGRQRSQRVLEREADHPRRDRRRDDQPDQALGARLDPPRRQRVEKGADQLDPVAPVVRQQPQRTADVQHHHQRQPERLRLRLRVHQAVPAEQSGNRTVCPRLEIGNSSVTPCRKPSTTAWK